MDLFSWIRSLFEKPKADTPPGKTSTPPKPAPPAPLPTAFDEAFKYVLVDEGGYSNDPGDSGGPTKYGITIHDLSAYQNQEATIQEVKDMTLDTARNIYKRNYWDPMNLNFIIDPRIAIALFDIGIVCGIGTAAHLAQEACKCPVTMKMDTTTISSINGFSRKAFIDAFEALDEARFEAIASEHSNDVKFLKGWLNRAKRLLQLEAA